MVVRRNDVGYSRLLAEPFALVFPRSRMPLACEQPRIPIATAHALLQRAVANSGDRAIGLKAGRRASHGDGGALDYAMHSAENVEQALATMSRYIRLLNGELMISLGLVGEEAFVRLESRALDPAVAEDFLMSALYTVHMCRLLPPGSRLACWFTQPEPPDRDAHLAAFPGAQLRFAAPRRGFSFERALFEAPLPSADPKLYRILVAQLERDLRELPEAPLFTERVRNLMFTETPLAHSTLPTVATALKMSARTLARRLASEGTSFGDLLDHVRRTRALAYLEEDQLRVEEIAAALGFSRASAFHRAFKRWTGVAPSEYRLAVRKPRRVG